jgi:CheY-like chemotaxis protein
MTTERNISILYAEDDPQARAMLLKLLHHKFPEITVYVAGDGAQGVALYEEHHPAVVLADITMPVMDGMEITRQIRKIDPDACVIALTAYNDAEWQRQSAELRFNLTLTKPVEFTKLLDAVTTALAPSKASTPQS